MGQCWGGVAGAVSQGEGLPRPRTCISQDEGCGSREGPGGAEEGAGAGPFPRVSRTLWGPGKVPSPRRSALVASAPAFAGSRAGRRAVARPLCSLRCPARAPLFTEGETEAQDSGGGASGDAAKVTPPALAPALLPPPRGSRTGSRAPDCDPRPGQGSQPCVLTARRRQSRETELLKDFHRFAKLMFQFSTSREL